MCGIAGIISTEKTKFDLNHFNILGTLNDERGGDSCGVFIDGISNYGIKETARFRMFTSNVEYPKKASIALVHCRKASPGYPINLEQAQPVVISRDGNVEFVLMHNGTITNINALALKYIPDVNIKGLSDSQILAQIIYEHGYDVLKEYSGCAVIVTIDYRAKTPSVLIFKGSSCYNENNSNSERPLYHMYYQGKFYFSSMYCSLRCISHDSTIYSFPTNKLYKVSGDGITCIKVFDRSTLTKSPGLLYSQDYRTTNYSCSRSHYNYNSSIYYDSNKGLYVVDNKNAHGILRVYLSGYLHQDNYSAFYTYELPFFNGRLLYNKECYKFLESLTDLFEDDVLYITAPEVVDYFSYNPRTIGGKLYSVGEDFKYSKYNEGKYVTLFLDGKRVQVYNGNPVSEFIYPKDALEDYLTASKNVVFNFDELESQVIRVISNKLVDNDSIQ